MVDDLLDWPRTCTAVDSPTPLFVSSCCNDAGDVVLSSRPMFGESSGRLVDAVSSAALNKDKRPCESRGDNCGSPGEPDKRPGQRNWRLANCLAKRVKRAKTRFSNTGFCTKSRKLPCSGSLLDSGMPYSHARSKYRLFLFCPTTSRQNALL
jgi:hypothetical protein